MPSSNSVSPSTGSGLQPATGAKWKDYPLGSTRLTAECMTPRFTWVDEEGKPKKPDWDELRKLQVKQELQALEKREKSRPPKAKGAPVEPAGKKPAAKKTRGVPAKSSSATGGEAGSLPAPSLSAPPPSAPPEEPPDASHAALWVQIQSEAAPEELWGHWGPAADASSEEATFYGHYSKTPQEGRKSEG